MAAGQQAQAKDATGTYRVVNALVVYDESKTVELGGRKRTLQVRRSARFGEEIELSAAEAERLLGYNAVKPADEAKSYDEMYVDQLEQIAKDRGLYDTVKGSGANGHVLKDDLVKALNADDAAKGVPAA
jgi:hypothetical protein